MYIVNATKFSAFLQFDDPKSGDHRNGLKIHPFIGDRGQGVQNLKF